MKKRILYLFIILLNIELFCQYPNIRVNNAGSTDPEEVSIAINPANPNYLSAGANIKYMYYSSNGGYNWTQKNLSSTFGVWGDPCVMYDKSGNLFYGHLSNPVGGGYWIDRIVVQKSTDNGLTWNDGAGIGFTNPKNQDKEWLAVDYTNNNVYVSWTEFDNYGSAASSDSSRIMFSRSTDRGNTWSTSKRISTKGGDCYDSGNTTEGAVPTVGPNGEVYVAWSGPTLQGELGISITKSTDFGETFSPNKFVTSQPGGWDFSIPGINRANGLPVTLCDTSRAATRGNLYILWGDLRNGQDNSDVFIIKSSDGGNTWGQVVKVNNDNTTRHQFFPWLTIDQTTGFLYVVFYDRRNTSGLTTDVYVARSTDGGSTFENFKVSETSFTPNSGVFFGDYTNIAAYNKKVYPIWMRLDNDNLSVYTAIINDTSAVTPVELQNFAGNVIDGKAVLNWQTITEKNNRGFEIEKALGKDGKFVTIGFVNGAGTTSERKSYEFIDKSGTGGIANYRLKQIDFDGSFTYSKPVELNIIVNQYALLQNYPNPFNPSTTISYQIPVKEFVVLKVYDILGKEVKTLVSGYMPAGVHEVKFDASGLASGAYFYKVTAGSFTSDKKMVVIK